MLYHRTMPLLFGLGLSLLLTACAAPADQSGTADQSTFSDLSLPVTAPLEEHKVSSVPFTLPVYEDYSLHPALSENKANLTLAPLLYEGLFSLDATFTPKPLLCQSYQCSGDGLVWTFTLRPGVTFSDGTPLTGALAADALRLAAAPQSRFAQRLAGLQSVTGDDTTVTATLSAPNTAFHALLDIPLALGEGDRPLGTGPYVLAGTESDLHLQARSGWWQGTSLPADTIPLSPVQQTDDMIVSFDAGNISLLDVDLMATNALGYSGSYEVWDYSTSTLVYLGLNTQQGPCKSPQLRRALALGIDRQSVADASYAHHAVAASLPVHPVSPLYDGMLAATTDYDPAACAAAVAQITAPMQTLRLLVNTENTAKAAAAQRLSYQLQAAGLPVEVVKLPWTEFTAALGKGDFDLYLGEVLLTADFDLSPLVSTAGALNHGGWTDGDTDGLLSLLRGAPEEGRPAAASALYAHLAEQAPIVPICFKSGSVLTQWGRVSGLEAVQNDVFFSLDRWVLS